jgi:hypothetical protein
LPNWVVHDAHGAIADEPRWRARWLCGAVPRACDRRVRGIYDPHEFSRDKPDAFEAQRRNAEGGLRRSCSGGMEAGRFLPRNWCSWMSPGLELSLSAPSLICRRRCLRHNTGSRSHFPNWIPQTARHVVVGHLIERYGIHWWWHPREARPFDRRCVNDRACFDQSRSYRPARPGNLVFHRRLPFCCRRLRFAQAGVEALRRVNMVVIALGEGERIDKRGMRH